MIFIKSVRCTGKLIIKMVPEDAEISPSDLFEREFNGVLNGDYPSINSLKW